MKLVVEVVHAYNLLPKVSNGTVNSFVEVSFDGQRQRTQTKYHDLSPSWNETLVFDVSDPHDLLDRTTIDVSVYHNPSSSSPLPSQSVYRRNFLGRVRLTTSSVATSHLEAEVQLCPLEKRSMFSRVTGEISLKLYFIPDSNNAAGNNHVPSSNNATGNNRVPTSSVGYPPTIPESSNFSDADINGEAPEAMPPPKRKTKKNGTQPPPSQFGSNTTTFSPMHSQYFRNNVYSQANPVPRPPVVPMLPPPSPYALIETQPLIPARAVFKWIAFIYNMLGYSGATIDGGHRLGASYDLVEQEEYLYVNIVKARDLPHMDITGSLDPYVEVRVGNFNGKTKHQVKNRNPEWFEVFAFAKEHLQAHQLEVVVKDKDIIRDDYVGKVVVELIEVPARVPPDGPVAPQWHQLRNDGGHARGELMMAVWKGTQADDAYPEAWHSDGHSLPYQTQVQTRAKVYFNPRMCYLRIYIDSAQDLVRSNRNSVHFPTVVKIQLGQQLKVTQPSTVRSNNPSWHEVFTLVGHEPYDEPLVITVEERVGSDKDVPLGQLVLSKSQIGTWTDRRKLKPLEWFDLSEPNSNVRVAGLSNGNGNGKGNGGEHEHSSKLGLRVYYDPGYHVLDEPLMFSSDFQPSDKQLWTPKIGRLELGILDARNLLPAKSNNGKGSVDAYCVAKYGPKWVRTRTILNTTTPRWNEQYSWDVFDTHTVLTVAVVDNCRTVSNGNGNGSATRDRLLGKIRIRLSMLESGRVYTYYYPLPNLRPSGLVKSGELHLAFRFTYSSLSSILLMYMKPLLPEMHYFRMIPPEQMKLLRHHAMLAILSKLARAEPPLPKEVVEHILDPPTTKVFSMRKSKANVERLKIIFSTVVSIANWFDNVQNWKNPMISILVHKLVLVFGLLPRLILPTVFISVIIVGVENYRSRPRHPPHVDTILSFAEVATLEELEEEHDEGWPLWPEDVTARRYDNLRKAIRIVQQYAGDLANHAERLADILSWRDPRATPIFMAFALFSAIVVYITPFKFLAVLFSLYNLRHPVFRTRTPSVPLNFFKRLPGKADSLL